MDSDDSARQAQLLLASAEKKRKFSFRSGACNDIFKSFTEASPYRLWKEFLAFFRRFRTVTILIRLTGWIFAALQTGTLLILSAAVFFVLLPLIGILAVFLFLVAVTDRRHSKRRLQAALAGSRDVTVFFSPGTVTAATARELAGNPAHTVLIVSPYWISGRGSDGKRARYYANLRRESDRVFLLRRYFFFSARRMFGDRCVSMIY